MQQLALRLHCQPETASAVALPLRLALARRHCSGSVTPPALPASASVGPLSLSGTALALPVPVAPWHRVTRPAGTFKFKFNLKFKFKLKFRRLFHVVVQVVLERDRLA